MARIKTSSGVERQRKLMGRRLLELREDYKRRKGQAIWTPLGVPSRSWYNWEHCGNAMPAELMLRMLLLTGARAEWVLTGEGDPYTEPGAIAESLDPWLILRILRE